MATRRDAFRAEYLAHFASADVDVILCPPTPGPAPRLETSKYWNYTSLFNLLDYPGAVFPTGLTVDDSDMPDPAYKFTGESDKLVWEACGCLPEKDAWLMADDSPGSFEVAPLSYQLVGQRWEDEKLMEALEVVSGIVCA